MRRRAPLVLALLFAVGCADTPTIPGATDEGLTTIAAAPGNAPDPENLTFSTPMFGLSTAPNGSLLVAEATVGLSEVRKGESTLIASLAGASGVAAVGGGSMFGLTGGPLGLGSEEDPRKLFWVTKGGVQLVADLGAYEEAENPDQIWNPGGPDSNPFNLAHLGDRNVLVADAAGNSILHVDSEGNVDWVAVLTPLLASTANLKALLGCPDSGAPICGLPPAIPAQPVATSIAVGPDGAWYAGELTGFPAEPGISRIWRIEPGSRHVLCPSADCTLALDGFTSIIDMTFGPDGTLYVVELDEATWLAVEFGPSPGVPVAGGTLNACDVGSGVCSVLAAGLSLPSAVTVGADGTVYVAENSSLFGGTGTIRAIN